MIQRIQHVFMLLSAAATGMMIYKPLINIEVPDGESGLMYANALKTLGGGEIILSSLPLFILICVVTIIPLVCISLYKKRMLQMRGVAHRLIHSCIWLRLPGLKMRSSGLRALRMP